MFHVGLTRDFLMPDGTLAFGDIGLDLLEQARGVKHEFLVENTKELTASQVRDFDALLVLAPRVTAATLDGADRLTVLARFGVGYDTVDVDACTRNAVLLTITPDGVRRPVATSVIAYILALSHKMFAKDRLTRDGRWAEKLAHMGVGLTGRVLGIVGLGNIGREVAKLAASFDLRIIAADPYVTREQAAAAGADLVDLDTLMRTADFVSVNCALTAETRHLIDGRRLALMRRTAFLINTARGPVVDEPALTEALRERRIAGAALDVFEQEPPPADHPLLGLEQVIVTPHLGAATDEAQTAVALAIAAQVADALLHGVVVNAVNLPSIDAETSREQAPWHGLAEKMGRFLAQMAEGRMQEARLTYSGEIAGRSTPTLTLALVRGLLGAILSERVTDVNALPIAKSRGLKITETSTTEAEDYASLVAAELVTDRGIASVAGTVFFKREARFVRVDGFPLEALPQGWMLVFANLDVPGVIGRIGTLCGRDGINIAGMQLGRERRGGRAVSILNLDDPMPPAALDEIRAMPDIVFAKLVKL